MVMDMSIFNKKYFHAIEEYPKDIADRGVENSILYGYVSSTFLNGFINYVEVIESFMVERYTDWSDAEVHKSNKEAVEKLNSGFHSDFSSLEDDVIILATTEDFYWLFWYDKDCSDCSIGKFPKGGYANETVVKDFRDSLGLNTLQLSLSGWIKG